MQPVRDRKGGQVVPTPPSSSRKLYTINQHNPNTTYACPIYPSPPSSLRPCSQRLANLPPLAAEPGKVSNSYKFLPFGLARSACCALLGLFLLIGCNGVATGLGMHENDSETKEAEEEVVDSDVEAMAHSIVGRSKGNPNYSF